MIIEEAFDPKSWKRSCTCDFCESKLIVSMGDFSNFSENSDDRYSKYEFNCPICNHIVLVYKDSVKPIHLQELIERNVKNNR
jgi:transcription elongation factor Elf1